MGPFINNCFQTYAGKKTLGLIPAGCSLSPRDNLLYCHLTDKLKLETGKQTMSNMLINEKMLRKSDRAGRDTKICPKATIFHLLQAVYLIAYFSFCLPIVNPLT